MLAFALAATLAITLRQREPCYARRRARTGPPALDPEPPYQPVGGTWPVPDLAASALFPGYAFAQAMQLVLAISAADNIQDGHRP